MESREIGRTNVASLNQTEINWDKNPTSKMKKPDYSTLRELFRPHIDSFDYFIDKGMDLAIKSIRPIEVLHPSSNTKLRIFLGVPKLTSPRFGMSARSMYPKECREARATYRGELTVELLIQYNEGPLIRNKLSLGHIPIMLMSKRCHLRGADPQKLIYHGEEATEMGGYFICNGLERLCRLLILPKRNYPMGLVRKSYCERGHGYSDKAIIMRCVREDESSLTVKLYYLQNGSARLGFWAKGREFLLPIGLVLKALIDTNDHEIYVSLTSCYNERYQREKGAVGSQLIGERAQVILDEVRKLSLYTRSDCLKHLGEYFQPAIEGFEMESYTVVSEAVLRDYILVHLTSNHDKFNLLIFMLQKLYALVDQTAAPDNGDVLQNQEVLLPGNLMTIYLKAKIVEWLSKSRYQLIVEMAKENDFDIKDRVASYFNAEVKIKDFRDMQRSVLNVLIRLGISPSLPKLEHSGPPEVLHVLLDGRVVGSVACNEVEKAVKHIRSLKLSASSGIPEDLEVGYVPSSLGGAYPGIYGNSVC